MLKQKNPYGCGLYAVANACNLPEFITPERLEISEAGNVIGQLSKWLQDDGHPLYIEVLYYDHLGTTLPESALHYVPEGPEDVQFLPILMNVRLVKNGKNHMIGGRIDRKGTLFIFDSLKEGILETKLKYINALYEEVYGLFIFAGVDNGDYVFIHKD